MPVIGSVHRTTVVPLRTSQASIGKPQKQTLSLSSAPVEATAFDMLPAAESTSLATVPSTEAQTDSNASQIDSTTSTHSATSTHTALATHTAEKTNEATTPVESAQKNGEIQIASAASTHTTDKPSEESTTVESIQAVASAQDSKHVCWIGEKRSPLQADHQVELLHLQAEADALLIKLQSAERRKMIEVARL